MKKDYYESCFWQVEQYEKKMQSKKLASWGSLDVVKVRNEKLSIVLFVDRGGKCN